MNEERRIIRSGEGDDDAMTIEPIEFWVALAISWSRRLSKTIELKDGRVHVRPDPFPLQQKHSAAESFP